MEESQIVTRVDRVRQVRFELAALPKNLHEDRAAKLEAIGPDADRSAHWRAMYRHEILSWYRALAKTYSRAEKAVLARGNKHAPGTITLSPAQPGGH